MKTVAEANKHVCVQAAGNETAVVCRADICMAWRDYGPHVRVKFRKGDRVFPKDHAERQSYVIVEELGHMGDCRLLREDT